MNTVAVTGSRDWKNRKFVWDALDKEHKKEKIGLLVHGGAKGVDTFAAEWADSKGIQTAVFPVTKGQWNIIGKGAGPIRNACMLRVTKPNKLLAFPGNAGTKSCIECAECSLIPVKHITE